jgi:hypothetical protein
MNSVFHLRVARKPGQTQTHLHGAGPGPIHGGEACRRRWKKIEIGGLTFFFFNLRCWRWDDEAWFYVMVGIV